MARFPFTQPRAWPRRRIALPSGAPPARADAGAGGTACERLRGPGWFDSSWELQVGLVVREGWPEDVRLDEWIDGFCAGDPRGQARPAERIVSPSSITASA